jgi:adenine specific DNA methylase Mod
VTTNKLYFGDNLVVLRHDIPDESVDLVYLDPPFNSNATYNVLFKSPTGQQSQAQIEAFEDTWHWGQDTEIRFDEVMNSGRTNVSEMLRAMRSFLGENDMMAYLVMMAVRLIELHRVLKPTGSLYLHCDPTASHYLKLLLDGVFGPERFLNEVIWKRTSAHSSAKRYGPVHDILFYYSKSDAYVWNQSYQPYDQYYLDQFYTHIDADGRRWRRSDLTGAGIRHGETGKKWRGIDVTAKGRHWAYPPDELERMDEAGKIHWPKKVGGMPMLKRYLDEQPGMPLQDIFVDIPPMHNLADERLGYPTQKPLALLERIIKASSNEGDVVLDPFCGCGTAVHAAEKLKRHWIGIDVTHLAISLIEKRLNDAFPGIKYEVHGTPKDVEAAEALSALDKYQFQWWAVSLVNAQPYGDKKKGPDRGIDGFIYFKPDGKTTEKAVVSVKGGKNVGVGMVRELKAIIDREKAPIGVFISLAEPTAEMKKEAAAAGLYDCGHATKYPRIQLFTIAELFAGKKPSIPLVDVAAAFKKAAKEERAKQGKLL